jgi:hypothetical protein
MICLICGATIPHYPCESCRYTPHVDRKPIPRIRDPRRVLPDEEREQTPPGPERTKPL